jgi:hypothetical protein
MPVALRQRVKSAPSGRDQELEGTIRAISYALPVTEGLGIAFEHCRWAAKRGQTAGDVLTSVGNTASPLATWGEAFWKSAETWPELDHSGYRELNREVGEARGVSLAAE